MGHTKEILMPTRAFGLIHKKSLMKSMSVSFQAGVIVYRNFEHHTIKRNLLIIE